MAHPLRGEVSSSHNAKLRRMTTHYGEANPKMNIKLPQEKYKIEGPEPHVGYGADYAAANARSDKPARKSVSANPVATYRRGGKVKHEEKVEGRARGGRMGSKDKKGTHVNVIVAPQGQQSPPMAPSPQLAALAAKSMMPAGALPMAPPMGAAPPPMAPPMGAAPPMAGGMPPHPMMMPRKRGGHVKHADEAEDKALIMKTLKDQGLVRRARGGATLHMTAGSESGPGRLEKSEFQARHGDKRKQVV